MPSPCLRADDFVIDDWLAAKLKVGAALPMPAAGAAASCPCHCRRAPAAGAFSWRPVLLLALPLPPPLVLPPSHHVSLSTRTTAECSVWPPVLTCSPALPAPSPIRRSLRTSCSRSATAWATSSPALSALCAPLWRTPCSPVRVPPACLPACLVQRGPGAVAGGGHPQPTPWQVQLVQRWWPLTSLPPYARPPLQASTKRRHTRRSLPRSVALQPSALRSDGRLCRCPVERRCRRRCPAGGMLWRGPRPPRPPCALLAAPRSLLAPPPCAVPSRFFLSHHRLPRIPVCSACPRTQPTIFGPPSAVFPGHPTPLKRQQPPSSTQMSVSRRLNSLPPLPYGFTPRPQLMASPYVPPFDDDDDDDVVVRSHTPPCIRHPLHPPPSASATLCIRPFMSPPRSSAAPPAVTPTACQLRAQDTATCSGSSALPCRRAHAGPQCHAPPAKG